MGRHFSSYPFEVDDKQDAVILKNHGTLKKKDASGSRTVSRKSKSIIWINNPQYRFDLTALEHYNKLFLQDIPIFISSCSSELAPYFKKKNFELIKVGKEAVLDLSRHHLKKKSIKELIRAGNRRGNVIEIRYSDENRTKLEEFKLECVHGSEPQLKHFFNDVFLPKNRFFVLQDINGTWLGGITIYCLESGSVRTDLILRRKNAPRGVMEAVIKKIFDTLVNEGYKYWSLGEVPYIVYGSNPFSKEFFINFTGRQLRFAYDYLGLYKFKNKFNPIWNDIYICSRPKLKLITLIKISWVSNLIKLVFKKMLPN